MRQRLAHLRTIDRRIAASLWSASIVALVAALLAACGGIEGKIESACAAQIDAERVLEKHGADPPEQSQEECVRDYEAARKEHDRIGRSREFERDLQSGTEGFKSLKKKCEDADQGEC